MNLREKIDNSPMGVYQWAIVLMAAVMNFLDGFDVLAIAFTATNISKDFGLSKTEFGMLVSAGLIGMVVGSMVLAPLADKFGRRPILLLSVAFSAVGLAVSGFSTTSEILAFSRILTGLGVGGILVGTNVITSEYSSKKWRSFAISVYAAGFGIDWWDYREIITSRLLLARCLLCGCRNDGRRFCRALDFVARINRLL